LQVLTQLGRGIPWVRWGDDRGDLAAAFPAITRPAVSRHLRILRAARLVTASPSGREQHYRLDARPLAALTQQWFAQFAPLWEESLTRLKSTVEDR
jgi:DNA-binding transcriptional ArsR family regulator